MIRNQLAIKLVFLLLVLASCEEKRKYWVYFNKTHSEQLVRRNNAKKEIDGFPIDCKKELKKLSLSIETYSNWLNAGTAWLSQPEIKRILTSEFVKEVHPVSQLTFSPLSLRGQSKNLSFALEQIGGRHFINKGLTGKGVKIGIIDGGFLDADIKNGLAHVFENKAIIAYKDFLTPEMRKYGGTKGADDGHGTEVWEQVSGINTKKNVQFGLATEAKFYLARTDDGRKEYRKEEEYLIQALEWMDEQDVKLVNISLGYSNGYDNPKENYLPENIDGKFTAITRATRIASEEKGMLIIVSAGNDGQNDFKVVSAPGDAKGVVTVGSTNFKVWEKTGYSSIGPQRLGYLKPNICCFSSNGTSFSAPVITGLAACMMQLDSTLSNVDLKSIIEQSSHLYPYGNNYIGYGVPSCEKIYSMVTEKDTAVTKVQKKVIVADRNRYIVKLPRENGKILLFHKLDSVIVLSQVKSEFEKFKYVLNRPKGGNYTTIVADDFVKEVRWK